MARNGISEMKTIRPKFINFKLGGRNGEKSFAKIVGGCQIYENKITFFLVGEVRISIILEI